MVLKKVALQKQRKRESDTQIFKYRWSICFMMWANWANPYIHKLDLDKERKR